MKIEYILVVILAVGALAFLGTTFLNFGDTADDLANDATSIIEDVSGSSAGN